MWSIVMVVALKAQADYKEPSLPTAMLLWILDTLIIVTAAQSDMICIAAQIQATIPLTVLRSLMETQDIATSEVTSK